MEFRDCVVNIGWYFLIYTKGKRGKDIIVIKKGRCVDLSIEGLKTKKELYGGRKSCFDSYTKKIKEIS